MECLGRDGTDVIPDQADRGSRRLFYFTLTRSAASFFGRPCLARVLARVFNVVSSVR